MTVLERDPAAPPPPETAWDDWERRGVNQFRLPHFLLPSFRESVESELPTIAEGMDKAGAHRFNPIVNFSGGMMNDPELDVLTARRPVLESVVAHAAAETPGLTIRRGVPIAGLVAAPERNDVTHVKGVLTEEGEKVPADLVVDCMGRRTPLRRWLEDIGCPPVEEEVEDSGFVYFGCHVRSADGSPFAPGPSMAWFGSVGLLVLPADHGTAGIGLIATSGDVALRALRREGPWEAAMRLVPGGPQILDAERISPLVSMAKLEDRRCRPAVDGRPVASGLVVVGDSFASTNPTLGRGVSLGLLHSLALRDVVRDKGDEHPRVLAETFDQVSESRFTPWYRSTVWNDRHRLEIVKAAAAGRPVRNPDPTYEQWCHLNSLPARDPSVVEPLFRGQLLLRRRPEEIVADPAMQEALARNPIEPQPPSGPTREELLDAVQST